MLVLLGDTHGESRHQLSGRTREAVRAAGQVCHTGDFTTPAVYEALSEAAGADTPGETDLTAVYGNSDTTALRDRLHETATVAYDGMRLALAHGHRHDRTSLGLLARQAGADVVAVGHSHRHGIEQVGDALLVNPGSHADPRGGRTTHAELDEGRIAIRTPDGETLAERTL
jgi:putative phosphoesterase